MAIILLILVLTPLLGAVVNGFLGTWFRNRAHWVAVPALGIPFLLSCYVLWQMMGMGLPAQEFTFFIWLPTGGLNIPFGFYLDPLSAVMAFTVTSVSFFVHFYSAGYMKGDPGYRRFFSYLNLFVFFMLLLVLSSSYLLMFVG